MPKAENPASSLQYLRSRFWCLLLDFRGSALPSAVIVALPFALLATVLKLLMNNGVMESLGEYNFMDHIVSDSEAYRGYSFAVAFMLIFRTRLAYDRYWEGFTAGHSMQCEWFHGFAMTLAFAEASGADQDTTTSFVHRFVRLVSMLHAFASASLRFLEGTDTFRLIDPKGIDPESLRYLAECEYPTELCYAWTMQLISESLGEEGAVLRIPAPIMSRVYQLFANGMVAYHDSHRIQTTEFPMVYQQIMSLLLVMHSLVTPFFMCMWTNWTSWVFLFTFVAVLIYWGLYFTALKIEYPFGDGRSCFSAELMQEEFNRNLLILMTDVARRAPNLEPGANLDTKALLAIHTHPHAERHLGERYKPGSYVGNRYTPPPKGEEDVVTTSTIIRRCSAVSLAMDSQEQQHSQVLRHSMTSSGSSNEERDNPTMMRSGSMRAGQASKATDHRVGFARRSMTGYCGERTGLDTKPWGKLSDSEAAPPIAASQNSVIGSGPQRSPEPAEARQEEAAWGSKRSQDSELASAEPPPEPQACEVSPEPPAIKPDFVQLVQDCGQDGSPSLLPTDEGAPSVKPAEYLAPDTSPACLAGCFCAGSGVDDSNQVEAVTQSAAAELPTLQEFGTPSTGNIRLDATPASGAQALASGELKAAATT